MTDNNDPVTRELQAPLTKIQDELALLRGEISRLGSVQINSSRELAETDNLVAETTRIKAETEKIQLEISKLKNGNPSKLLKTAIWFRENAIALLTIFSMASTMVYGVFTFLDQQSDRDKFNVTGHVIELVSQLNSPGAEQSAILFAA